MTKIKIQLYPESIEILKTFFLKPLIVNDIWLVDDFMIPIVYSKMKKYYDENKDNMPGNEMGELLTLVKRLELIEEYFICSK